MNGDVVATVGRAGPARRLPGRTTRIIVYIWTTIAACHARSE
jgi:hypothetical protein